jgi:hypothetical protein
MHNLNRGKMAQNVGYFCNFQKTPQSKQSLILGKFTQSGHPVCKTTVKLSATLAFAVVSADDKKVYNTMTRGSLILARKSRKSSNLWLKSADIWRETML